MQTIRFKNFDFYPNQKILDIGCGQGRHCFGAYMHADLDVYGIDMGIFSARARALVLYAL